MLSGRIGQEDSGHGPAIDGQGGDEGKAGLSADDVGGEGTGEPAAEAARHHQMILILQRVNN
jgi:hypothetical protein